MCVWRVGKANKINDCRSDREGGGREEITYGTKWELRDVR